MNDKIFVTRPSLPDFEEYTECLRDIWSTRALTNLGKHVQELIKQLKDKLGVEYCLAMCNGHMALEMTLQALELKGEVITTPFTFASTTHAIVRNNLTPVFCDIKENDCTIDPDKIEALITDKTSAIVPVHVYGMPCDVDRIKEIADKHHLKIIYDAAHAFGVTLDGKGIANFGDASMFSFHATKAFNTIEGGCSVIHDANAMLKLYQIHNFGIMSEESVEFVGANAKMNEFQAVMGLCNLKNYEANRSKRKALVELYCELLKDTEGIRTLDYSQERIGYNYSYFPIFIDESIYGMNRDQVYEILKEQEIYTRKYFYPITCNFKCYKDLGFDGRVDVAERVSKQVLTLPLYPELEPENVERICTILKK